MKRLLICFALLLLPLLASAGALPDPARTPGITNPDVTPETN